MTYEITQQGRGTVLTVNQENNDSQEQADAMAENNWGPVLDGRKKVVEHQR